MLYIFYNNLDRGEKSQKCDFALLFSNMTGRAATPQGHKLNNINNMPNRRYLPSINLKKLPIDWTISFV
jgi:hypothetical protein